MAGTDGYFKKINPAFTITLGWTIEELLAKPFFDFIHPDDLTGTINEIKKLGTGEKTIGFENRFITKKGDYLRNRLISLFCYLTLFLFFATLTLVVVFILAAIFDFFFYFKPT